MAAAPEVPEAEVSPFEEHRASLPYLEALRHAPFSPVGSLYHNILSSLIPTGLVRRCGFTAYELTPFGREVLMALLPPEKK